MTKEEQKVEKKSVSKKEKAVPNKEKKDEAVSEKKEKPKDTHEAKKAPAAEKKPRKAKKKSKVVLSRGKRKEAIARAVVGSGKGRFVFNRIPFSAIQNKYIREIVSEPLNFLTVEHNSIDINVYVSGGGPMGQAQAARTAIAKALVEYTGDEKLKAAYLDHDRSMLVDDVRRVEPKKYKGPKARARYQKSYR